MKDRFDRRESRFDPVLGFLYKPDCSELLLLKRLHSSFSNGLQTLLGFFARNLCASLSSLGDVFAKLGRLLRRNLLGRLGGFLRASSDILSRQHQGSSQHHWHPGFQLHFEILFFRL